MGCFVWYLIIAGVLTGLFFMGKGQDSLDAAGIGFLGVIWGVAVIWLGFWIWVFVTAPSDEEVERRREEREREELLLEIVSDETLTSRFLSGLRLYQYKAQQALNKAEVHFNNNAYSPFWDEVEEATLQLSYFYKDINYLSDKLKAYNECASMYEGVPPSFPIMPDKVEKVNQLNGTLARRMKEVISAAQRDFHFASIFEQRRTRDSIAAGFESFEDALDDVGNQITTEMADLNSEMTSMIDATMAQREEHHVEVMEADSQRAEREEQALDMLEDISNRRNKRS